MHKIRYVILNGPPSSGKSTLAKEICSALNNGLGEKSKFAITDSFSAPMKHFFSAALGRQYDTFLRDNPVPELNGFTMRECLIDLAEVYIKGRYGDDIFGRWLIHRALHHPKQLPHYIIVDDGFGGPEINPMSNYYIIKVVREGKTFEGDNRRYYEKPDITFENKGPLPGLWRGAKGLAEKIKQHGWA